MKYFISIGSRVPSRSKRKFLYKEYHLISYFRFNYNTEKYSFQYLLRRFNNCHKMNAPRTGTAAAKVRWTSPAKMSTWSIINPRVRVLPAGACPPRMPAKTEKGRLAASLSGFRSFEINVKNVDWLDENVLSGELLLTVTYYTHFLGNVNKKIR